MMGLRSIIIACLLSASITVCTAETTGADSSSSHVPTATRQRHEQTTSASTPISAANFNSQSTASTTTFTTPTPTQTLTSNMNQWDGGTEGAGNQLDTEAAANGSNGGGFQMSLGGLIAVIVVVVAVVIFGIASLVLWIMAKRRQMTIRQSISYASRRLTGRGTTADRTRRNDAARRTAVRFANSEPDSSDENHKRMPKTPVRAVYPPGHKRGLVVTESDAEKGMGRPAPKHAWQDPLQGKVPKNPNRRSGGVLSKLWGNNWK